MSHSALLDRSCWPVDHSASGGAQRAFAAGRAAATIVQACIPCRGYYGIYLALWCGMPAFCWLVAAWLIFRAADHHRIADGWPARRGQGAADPSAAGLLIADIKNLATGNIVSRDDRRRRCSAAADGYARLQTMAGFRWPWWWPRRWRSRCRPVLRASGSSPASAPRNRVERIVDVIMIIASTIAILTTIGIVLSLLFEAIRFFSKVPFTEFLFGLHWSPQTALRADQVGASGAFGAIPLFAGTLLITFIAMCVAVPIGLFSAIYMSEYAVPPRCARSSSRCWRSWPASRPWSTASSPR